MIATAQRLATLDDLHQVMRQGRDLLYPSEPKIMVGMATCGQADCGTRSPESAALASPGTVSGYVPAYCVIL